MTNNKKLERLEEEVKSLPSVQNEVVIKYLWQKQLNCEVTGKVQVA